MFTCPRCNQPLARCKTAGGVYWRCSGCEGRTATVAMLRQSADADLVARLWEAAQSEFAPASLPCPACRASMKAAWMPASAGGHQLDLCTRCHVIWFDQREFEQAVGAAASASLYDQDIPWQARLALARLHVASLDPRPDVRLDSTPPKEDWKAIPAFFGMPVTHESTPGLLQAKATLCLALAGISLGLLGIYLAPQMLLDFGYIPAQASRLGYLTAFTSLLLYGSLPHLATSVYFLLMFGAELEDLLGAPQFLLLLLGTAVCGLGAHTALHPHSGVALLGAGPVISGLLAAYGLRFPRARIGFILRLPWLSQQWVNLPAWAYILFWIITQAMGAAAAERGIEQVSWSAHLGGAGAGAILGAVLGRGGPPRTCAQ